MDLNNLDPYSEAEEQIRAETDRRKKEDTALQTKLDKELAKVERDREAKLHNYEADAQESRKEFEEEQAEKDKALAKRHEVEMEELTQRHQREQQARATRRGTAFRTLNTNNEMNRNALIDAFKTRSDEILKKFNDDKIALETKRKAEDLEKAKELFQTITAKSLQTKDGTQPSPRPAIPLPKRPDVPIPRSPGYSPQRDPSRGPRVHSPPRDRYRSGRSRSPRGDYYRYGSSSYRPGGGEYRQRSPPTAPRAFNQQTRRGNWSADSTGANREPVRPRTPNVPANHGQSHRVESQNRPSTSTNSNVPAAAGQSNQPSFKSVFPVQRVKYIDEDEKLYEWVASKPEERELKKASLQKVHHNFKGILSDMREAPAGWSLREGTIARIQYDTKWGVIRVSKLKQEDVGPKEMWMEFTEPKEEITTAFIKCFKNVPWFLYKVWPEEMDENEVNPIDAALLPTTQSS